MSAGHRTRWRVKVQQELTSVLDAGGVPALKQYLADMDPHRREKLLQVLRDGRRYKGPRKP